VPDGDLYLGFIAKPHFSASTRGALYIKKVKFTTLETLKASCSEDELTGNV
jgi:hypothetical protein